MDSDTSTARCAQAWAAVVARADRDSLLCSIHAGVNVAGLTRDPCLSAAVLEKLDDRQHRAAEMQRDTLLEPAVGDPVAEALIADTKGSPARGIRLVPEKHPHTLHARTCPQPRDQTKQYSEPG